MPTSASATYFNELVARPQIWDSLRQSHRTNPAPINPIFVVGSPRSGTSVTGRIIGAHKDVRCTEESLFLTHLYDMLFELHLGVGQRRLAPLQHHSTADIIGYLGRLSDELFGSTRVGHGRIVDHTPWYGAIAPLLDAIYPTAVFVHILRNGVDVVTSLGHSYRKGFDWAGETVEQRAHLWSTMVQTCEAIAEHVGPARFVRIRYEDLITQPETTISGLLTALGLPWDPATLEPLSRPHSAPSRSNWMPGQAPGNATPASMAWSAAEKRMFSEAAGAVMQRHGYNDET